MSALETLSLVSLTIGAAAILRFVWLDSLRFADPGAGEADSTRVSARTAQRLAMQADAARILEETESLPKAA
ncbi:MAG: hypothetical protein K1Y01_21840 [Vicinamibacteria bacterium]|nr:hypothetical protein [Vicinamibacteria bacterium]